MPKQMWFILCLALIPCMVSADTYQVGPGRPYADLQSVTDLLQPGDIVEVDGDQTYPGGVVFTQAGTVEQPITIRGIRVNGNRPVIQGGTNSVTFQTDWPYNEGGADHYVFEGFDITGGTFRGIFHQAHDLTVRDTVVHDCASHGILGADDGSGTLILEYVEVHHCGGGGQHHQIYMSTDETNRPGSVFRMQHCYVHDANGGNNVKSRAERNEIYYNWIEGALYHELELIGSEEHDPGLVREDSDIVGNVLHKRNNWNVVRFGGDGTGETNGRYRFVNNTVICGEEGVFRLFDGIESLEVHNSVFYREGGDVTLFQDGSVHWTTGQEVIAGRNNWVQQGTGDVPAQWTGTVYGTDPGFTNLDGGDLRPTSGSVLKDAGTLIPSSPAGFAFPSPLFPPAYHPPMHAVEPLNDAVPRPFDGRIDVGGYEAAGTVSGGLFHVDDGNGTGTEDGTVQYPFSTIQAAIGTVTESGMILVAAGTYSESPLIQDKSIVLYGGYPGGTGADYAGGLGGDFGARDPSVHVVTVQGTPASGVVRYVRIAVEAPGPNLLDGFRITGGRHGVLLDEDSSNYPLTNITLAGNTIEGNGVTNDYEHVGGGVRVSGTGISLLDNTIRNNNAGRGGGIGGSAADLYAGGNAVLDNRSYGDHGGGIYFSGTGTFERNTVRGNRTGEGIGYGWGGGVIVHGGNTNVTLSHNVVTGNHAPNIGGGIDVDDSATAVLDHELVYGNTTSAGDKGGAGVYVDGNGSGSQVTILHSTIGHNSAPGVDGGNGIYVENGSAVEMRNCILWGNGDDFYVAPDGSSLTAAYCLSAEALAGAGNLSADPLFADPQAGDFHPSSTMGRWDPGTRTWVKDSAQSPAVDAGDPASNFSDESQPNGGRVNLGAFGNTAEASRTALWSPVPLAEFTASPMAGPAPLAVAFTDLSLRGPTSWQWDFDGNGTTDSTLRSPTHTYTAAGIYTVSLTVVNGSGQDSVTKESYIHVAATSGTDRFVDDDNTTGVTDGTPLHPYTSVQTAVNAAAEGDAILVAAGTYAESVLIEDKGLRLLGGFAGGTVASYNAGTPGDFTTRDTEIHVASMQGTPGGAVVRITRTSQDDMAPVLLDGFRITGGQRGVHAEGAWDAPLSNVTLSNNLIENNRLMVDDEYGGGIYFEGNYIAVMDNRIRNNTAGRGGGIGGEGPGQVILGNTIENNEGIGDHGGGVMVFGSGAFSRNLVRGNIVGQAPGYGWGGGACILEFKGILSHNVYTGNTSPSPGGGLFLDEGADVSLEHEIVYGNTTEDGGAGVYVDGGQGVLTQASFTNCTVAENTSEAGSAGNGVFVETSLVSLRNCILWGNSGDDFFLAADGSVLEVDYSLSEEVWSGTGNLSSDPLFADASGGDFHLRSTGGRWDPDTKGWVVDGAMSPAVDAGDPTSDYALETPPNGGRINMGLYGNSGEASRSSGPVVAPVAEFSANPVNGTAPLSVAFTDLSTNGPNSWSWDFDNDGTPDSAARNPSHTYPEAGSYTVSLSVENTAGSDVETKQDYIVVSESTQCSLSCTAAALPTTGQPPLTVAFTATATATNCTGQPAFSWTFGDGATSTVQNPSHSYTTEGTYNWTLTVTVDGETCTRSGTVSATTHVSTSWVSRGIGGGGALFSPTMSPHDPNLIYMATDMSAVFRSSDFGLGWVTLPFTEIQGGVYSEVRFTSDPSVLYSLFLDDNDNRTPVKSTDGGATWEPLGSSPWDELDYTILHVDPNGTDRLLGSEWGILFFSDDGGASFNSVYDTDNGAGICFAGAFWDGDTIFVATSDGLLVSTDGGASFSLAPVTGIPAGELISSFAGSKESGTTRFFAVTQSTEDYYTLVPPSEYSGYRGVYRLNWGEPSWTRVTTGIDPDALLFFAGMAEGEIDVCYVAGGFEPSVPTVYRTTNGGDTWASVFQTEGNGNISTGWMGEGGDLNWGWAENAMGFAVSPIDPDRAIITDWGFTHVTEDGGASWRAAYIDPSTRNPAGSPTPKTGAYRSNGVEDTSAWSLHWVNSTTLFASFTDIGGIRSADGGLTWSSALSTGLAYNSTYQVVEHPSNGTLYAATSSVHDLYQSTYLEDSRIDGGNGAVLFSADQGASWQMLHDFDHPVVWLAFDPNQPDTLFASVVHSSAGGVFVTHNLSAGPASTWSRLAVPARTHGHPFNIRVLTDGTLVATYSGWRDAARDFQEASGLFVSTDGGTSWEDRSDPGMRIWTKDVIIDPHDPGQQTWYVTVFSHWGRPPNEVGGVYRTTDRGQTWTRISDLYRVNSLAIHPDDPNEAYISTEAQGLWKTENLGDPMPTLTQITDYPFRHPIRIFFNPFDHNEVWVTSFGNGLRVSSPSGQCTLSCTASAAPTTGPEPLSVSFSSTVTAANCTGQPAFSWTFGDGGTSSAQNPSHSYATAGTYTWTLTVSVDGETCTQSGSVIVTGTACELTCSGSASPNTGQAPLTVSFAGLATATNCTGQPTFSWTFGDGGTSTQQNPSHEYTAAGTYGWVLTVTVDDQTCSQSGSISVQGSGEEGLCVDDGNTTGTEDGTPEHPYTSIQAAVGAAASGGSVRVAGGIYAETVTIQDKTLSLLGGYAGGSPADYTGGTGGDFTTRDSGIHLTTIQGTTEAAVVRFVRTGDGMSGPNLLDGFRITGGRHGILLDDEVSWPPFENISISNNIIEANGVTGDSDHWGGGINIWGSDISVLDNVIRNNNSGWGAGIYSQVTGLLLRGNTIENSVGYADHGGGLFLEGSGIIEGNLIRGNRIGEGLGYGWGGGLCLYGGTWTLSGNTYEGNFAPSPGGGLFVDEGADATLDHELVFGNTTEEEWQGGGAGIFVDGGPVFTTARFRNCTIAMNSSPGTAGGNGIFVMTSTVEVSNSIFWGNSGDDFFVEADGSTLAVTYSLTEEAVSGTGNFTEDPLFADPASGDFHLKSTAGRWDPGAQAWVTDGGDSPAVDAGDPATPFSSEPEPNGDRANLGAFGNTAEASKSSGGLPPPVADFSADPRIGPPPMMVAFTDLSIGDPTSWEWDFDGDGSADSTEQNPTHEYTDLGIYTVNLTVANATGVDSDTKEGYIQVIAAGGLPGDCDGNGTVSIGEVQKVIRMHLRLDPAGCGADCDSNGIISIGELQKVINAHLRIPVSC